MRFLIVISSSRLSSFEKVCDEAKFAMRQRKFGELAGLIFPFIVPTVLVFHFVGNCLCFLLHDVAAVQDQRNASAAAIESTVGESPPAEREQSKEKTAERLEPFNLNIQQDLVDGESEQGPTPPFIHTEFHVEDGIESSSNVGHQFIPSFTGRSPMHQNNAQENKGSKSLSALRNGPDEDNYVSLQLGEPEPKRRKHSDTSLNVQESK